MFILIVLYILLVQYTIITNRNLQMQCIFFTKFTFFGYKVNNVGENNSSLRQNCFNIKLWNDYTIASEIYFACRREHSASTGYAFQSLNTALSSCRSLRIFPTLHVKLLYFLKLIKGVIPCSLIYSD